MDPASRLRRVIVKCCGSDENKERLSIERRLKLNLEKVLFRGDKEVFEYLERRYRPR